MPGSESAPRSLPFLSWDARRGGCLPGALHPPAPTQPVSPPGLTGSRRGDAGRAALTGAVLGLLATLPLRLPSSGQRRLLSSDEPSSSPTLRGVSPPPDRPDAVSPLLLCPHHPELHGLQPLPRQPVEAQQARWVLSPEVRGAGGRVAALPPSRVPWAPGSRRVPPTAGHTTAPHSPGAEPRTTRFSRPRKVWPAGAARAGSRVIPAGVGCAGLPGVVLPRFAAARLLRLLLSFGLISYLAPSFPCSSLSPFPLGPFDRLPCSSTFPRARAPRIVTPDRSGRSLPARVRACERGRGSASRRGPKPRRRTCISRKRATLMSLSGTSGCVRCFTELSALSRSWGAGFLGNARQSSDGLGTGRALRPPPAPPPIYFSPQSSYF